MEIRVLTVIFYRSGDFTAQEPHLKAGAFYIPAPDPPPKPLDEVILYVQDPAGGAAEFRARVVQVFATGIALTFHDADAARKELLPAIEAAKSARGDAGDLPEVRWGRPEIAFDLGGDEAESGGTDDERMEVSRGLAEETGAEALPEFDLEVADEPKSEDEKRALHDRIRAMSPQEKMNLAKHGDKSARLILMRDTNKSVHIFVIQNPRISVEEIAWMAGFPQTNPECLLQIAANPEWTRNARVVGALVRNPKTPPTQAVKLLEKLPMAEIRRLAKSPHTPKAVSAAAKKKALSSSS